MKTPTSNKKMRLLEMLLLRLIGSGVDVVVDDVVDDDPGVRLLIERPNEFQYSMLIGLCR